MTSNKFFRAVYVYSEKVIDPQLLPTHLSNELRLQWTSCWPHIFIKAVDVYSLFAYTAEYKVTENNERLNVTKCFYTIAGIYLFMLTSFVFFLNL